MLIELPIAGPTSRMLAYAIDLCAILLLEAAALFAVLLSTPLAAWLDDRFRDATAPLADPQTAGQAQDPAAVLWLLAFFLVLQLVFEWGYFAVVELATGGRSLGKVILGLRVVRDGGLPIGLREAVLRTLFRAVDMLPTNYLVGLVSMVISREHRRLGDLVAGTVVIRLDRPEAAASAESLEQAGDGGFRFDRAQLERIGSPERALLRETLRRVPALEPEIAHEAIRRAADVLCRKLDRPPVGEHERLSFLRALLAALRTR